MSVSHGIRIISVAKSLDAFQRDPSIARYFGATLLAGHAGLFLSALRKHKHVTWDKFIVLAANARIERQWIGRVIVPWLTQGGFIEVGSGDAPSVNCNVVDYDAILRATATLFTTLDPTLEERLVLDLVEQAIRIPTSKEDALNQLADGSDQPARTAIDLAKGFQIVKVLEGPGIREPMIYSPLIWGDNIGKAGQALSHLPANQRAILLALIDRVRQYQGLPEKDAITWASQQGQNEIVGISVALGLLDRTEIHTKAGSGQSFLTTPHLYGELAVQHGRDVCDRIRLFLDSIRHGQHFGKWHTGRIKDPTVLLTGLLDKGEIGPCTAIGNDYVLVEKAGVVTVKPSTWKRGQYVMELVQDDTVRAIRDILRQQHSIDGLSVFRGDGAMGQDRFISSEQTRAAAGQLPAPMLEAEAEMLRSLREMI
jgi:hypothetical protein